MFCKLLIYNYKLQNNSEITNLFRALFIPNWRIGWVRRREECACDRFIAISPH